MSTGATSSKAAFGRPGSGPDFSGIARQGDAYRAAVMAHIEEKQPCCVAGFPDHNNSGDSAIYLGELKLFDEIGSRRDYVCTKDNYRADIEAHYPDGPIFLHGGGNFGDLYGENGLRLKLLDRYRDRKIVQLPQTIHFQRQAGVEEMARAIAAHGDFHLMVRDIASLDFAQAKFDCPVTLVPDAAYYLESLAPSTAPRRKVLTVQRTDGERASDGMSAYLRSLGPVRDWRGRTAPWSHYRWVARKHVRLRLTSQPAREEADMEFREKAYAKRARDRLRIAVDVLSEARITISDRLHAHIIASLLRKPHIALDNTYGKIGSYLETWGNDALAMTAQDEEMLRVAVAHLVQGLPVPETPGRGWAIREAGRTS